APTPAASATPPAALPVAAPLATWLGPTPTGIIVYWVSSICNAQTLRIERGTQPTGTFTQVAEVSPGAQSYTDTTAVANQTYYYRINGHNSIGDGPNGDTVSGSISAPPSPSYLNAGIQSTTQLYLSWDDRSQLETGFNVQRSTTSPTSGFSSITTTAANV